MKVLYRFLLMGLKIMKKVYNLIEEFFTTLFSLSPSVYTILSGALVGAAVNLLTGLIFAREVSSISVKISIILLLFSSVSLAYIGITLEGLHSDTETEKDLSNKIKSRQNKLYFTVLGVLRV